MEKLKNLQLKSLGQQQSNSLNQIYNKGQMRKLIHTILRYKSNQPSTTTKQILQAYNNSINSINKQSQTSTNINGDIKKQKIQKIIRQTGSKLNKIQKQAQLSKIKQYLKQGIGKQQQNIGKLYNVEQQRGYIPNNLVVKKLNFLDKRILLLGVDEENEDHCIYLKQIAQKMNTKIVLTALPPDMPYFIKTQLSFAEEWKKFVTKPQYAKQCKFYLNPSPHHVKQFALSKSQMELVRRSLNKSKQFNQIFYTIMQSSKHTNRYYPNALLTPLLINSVEKLYFCDFPVLKQRQFWALAIPTQRMRQLFQIYHRQIYKDKQLIFDPRILFPKQVINKKFQHMANAVKYSTHQSKQPTIFVCPSQYVQMFCMQFKKDRPISQFSDFAYSLNIKNQTAFIDFVENLPIIDKYFVKHLSFPYTALQTLGGKQNIGKIFPVWKHFHNMYTDALLKQPNN